MHPANAQELHPAHAEERLVWPSLRVALPLGLASHLVTAAPLSAWLSVSALAWPDSARSPRDAALIALVYTLLGACLTEIAAFLAERSGRARLWSGVVGAGAMTWQLHCLVRFPHDWLGALGTVAALGLLHGAWLAHRTARALRTPAWTRLLGAAGLAFASALACVPAFLAWNDFRYELLRHDKTLAPVLYRLFLEPTSAVNTALWETGPNARVPEQQPAFGAAGRLEGRDATTPPDLVFVLIDTLRADRLSAFGGPAELMPNLNAFAARSVVFRDVMANASWTRPSIGSMFTGLLPEQHGAVDKTNALSRNVRTLPELLRERGYATAAFVSNYGAISREAGFARGFETFVEIAAGAAPYPRADSVTHALRSYLTRELPRVRPAPVFLYVHYLDPHAPSVARPTRQLTRAALEAAYDADLRAFDAHFPQLLAALEGSLGPDARIVVVADHGEGFGEHGARGHGTALTPEQVHVPLVAYVPGVTPARSEARLEGRDVFHLFDHLQGGGRDLTGFGREHARAQRYRSVFLTHYVTRLRPHRAVVGMRAVEDGALLLTWSAYGSTYELYDLRADPGQHRNLYERHPDWGAALAPALEAPMRARVDPPLASSDRREIDALYALGYVE